MKQEMSRHNGGDDVFAHVSRCLYVSKIVRLCCSEKRSIAKISVGEFKELLCDS